MDKLDLSLEFRKTIWDLPSSVSIQLDGTYYQGIQYDSTYNSQLYAVTIKTPRVTKAESAGVLRYSFNGKEYFQSQFE